MDRISRPFFVYGTLRPGHGNYRRLLEGRTTLEEPATVPGIALHGLGIPFAVRQRGSDTVGALIHVDPAVYAQTLTDLDQLEGYRPGYPRASLYVRRAVMVRTATAAASAWIYLAAAPERARRMDPVPGNDWALISF